MSFHSSLLHNYKSSPVESEKVYISRFANYPIPHFPNSHIPEFPTFQNSPPSRIDVSPENWQIIVIIRKYIDNSSNREFSSSAPNIQKSKSAKRGPSHQRMNLTLYVVVIAFIFALFYLCSREATEEDGDDCDLRTIDVQARLPVPVPATLPSAPP